MLINQFVCNFISKLFTIPCYIHRVPMQFNQISFVLLEVQRQKVRKCLLINTLCSAG